MVIPFSVFMVCCLAQFYFLARVRRALAERHPELLRDLVGNAFFFASNAIGKFAWRRGDRGLDDPELTERVKQYKRLMFVAIGAWAAYGVCIFSGIGLRPVSLDGLLGHAAPPAAPHSASAVGAAPARDIPPSFGPPSFGPPFFWAVFPAAFVVNGLYVALVWRLGTRWNALRLGPPVSMADAMPVLGVILWSTPATYDAGFQRLRLLTRAIGVLALAGTLTLFALAAAQMAHH